MKKTDKQPMTFSEWLKYGQKEMTFDEWLKTQVWTKMFRKQFGLKLNQFKRENKKIGRNELCSCGSGKKYKKCCGAN